MSKTILFFGNERLATGTTTSLPVLKALLENGYNVPAVVLSQHEQAKSRHSRTLEIADFAKVNNIEIIKSNDQLVDKLISYDANLSVLVAYGQIVSKDVIDVFPKGIINIHPSLLPHYRGSTPIESAILDQASETGVTLMSLSPELDAGPIYAQIKVVLGKTESKQELTDRLAKLGSEMLIEQLPAILDGSTSPTSQTEDEVSYTSRIDKESGLLNFNKPATRLESEIRAYQDWPRSTISTDTLRLVITRAHVEDGSGAPGEVLKEKGKLGIYTSSRLLVIDSLIPAGKKEMSGSAYLAGNQDFKLI